MTTIGKQVWNEVRRHMSSTQVRVMTDSQYGGPAPVQAFLTAEQRIPSEIVEGSERPRWAERYFWLRPQFGNAGVPPYPDEPQRSDGGTLPLYLSHLSEQLASLQLQGIGTQTFISVSIAVR